MMQWCKSCFQGKSRKSKHSYSSCGDIALWSQDDAGMGDRACESLPVHSYALSVLGSLHPSWPSSWLHMGSLPCGTEGKGSCIFPVWEITKMLPFRLLVSPILSDSSFEVFKECDSLIFSPSEKLCCCSPVKSAWAKQDSSHLIYDVSASDVDNLHLFHSL